MKLILTEIQIEYAHRIGPKQGGKTRTIVAKMSSYKDCEKVLRMAKEKLSAGIFINQDFSVRVSKVRKELRSQLQTMKQRGIENAYLSFDRIRYRSQLKHSGGPSCSGIRNSGPGLGAGQGSVPGGMKAPWANKAQQSTQSTTIQPRPQGGYTNNPNAKDEDLTSLKQPGSPPPPRQHSPPPNPLVSAHLLLQQMILPRLQLRPPRPHPVRPWTKDIRQARLLADLLS